MRRITFPAAFVLLVIAACVWPAVGSPPSSLGAKEIARQVTIRRDTYGVPHILVATKEAASFGFGFAQAEDHAVEIARRFIGGRGEMAKYFGTSVESDLLIKRFDNACREMGNC